MIARRWLLAAAALLLAAGPASAHSLLLEASPAPNARIEAGPPQLSLRFNNRVEKKLCRVRLVDGRGTAVVLTPATDGPPDRLVAPLPPLTSGPWRIEWQVLSTDGHVVTGTYTFHVGP